jgi:integrase
MASVRKKSGSRFWFGCFLMPDGRRVQRSTKSKDKMEALQIALSWERATRQKATVEQSRKVIAGIVKVVHGNDACDETVKGFFDRWEARKAAEIDAGTVKKYKAILKSFAESLSGRWTTPLAEVTTNQVARWRDGLANRLAPGTANFHLKIVRSVFRDAKLEGLVQETPAGGIKLLRRSVGQKRARSKRPFRPSELKKILAAVPADSEWSGMILAGLYTGQRLKDIALMRWLDIKDGWWKSEAVKTARPVCVPLAKPLADWLADWKKKTRSERVFPKAAGFVERAAGNTGTLSNQFYALLTKAGLVQKRSHDSLGKGRSASRDGGNLSFHCLRHTTNSLLKNAGVQESVAMDFVGHESESMSRLYTHVPEESLLAAVKKLEKALG